VEIIDGRVIIDFPGFNDSNGPLICLGIELALKALIADYKPKIVVLEAITNTGDRYAVVQRLAERLDRLLVNKQDCLLGLTQYSKHGAFIKICEIEDQQRGELDRETREESRLTGAIDALEEVLRVCQGSRLSRSSVKR